MQDLSSTQYFKVEKAPELKIGDVLEIVYKAMAEKGYNPINQIVGYIMSGDPTYITSYMNARSLIMKVERDETRGRSYERLRFQTWMGLGKNI